MNAEEDALFRPAHVQPARVANPLAADASLLRSTGLVSMAHTLAWNLNRGQRNVRLFEIGRTYAMNNGGPHEQRIVTIGATGLAREKSVAESATRIRLRRSEGRSRPDRATRRRLNVAGLSPTASWHNPARAGQISVAGPMRPVGRTMIGSAGQLMQRVAEQFKLRQIVFLGEFVLDPFYAACPQQKRRGAIAPCRGSPQSIAILRWSCATAPRLDLCAIRFSHLGIAEIASIEALDIFRGKQLPPGTFSLLVRVTFQSYQGTLTENQVADFSATILAALEQQHAAVLRTT